MFLSTGKNTVRAVSAAAAKGRASIFAATASPLPARGRSAASALLGRRMMTTDGHSGIQKVTVVGAGTLGTQVALQSAITGHDVTVLDLSDETLLNCRANHEAILEQYIARDKLANEGGPPQARGWKGLSSADKSAKKVAAETLERLHYTTSAEKALEGCDLMSENVPEVPDIKAATYKDLGKYAPESTIFTTNSSTLLPSDFVDAVDRPKKFLALHFANGIWDGNIGEVMPHPGTDPAITAKVLEFAKDIHMVPFHIQKEQNGYLINSLLLPWLNAAQTLVTNGVATSFEDVDKAWLISTGGYKAPKGAVLAPFITMDMIGLNLCSTVLCHWGEQLDDAQMMKNGLYIQHNFLEKNKTGIMVGNPLVDKAEGYYTYPNPAYMEDDFLSYK